MTRQEQYAVGQHALLCELLGVSANPDAPGKTAYEAVLDLKAKYNRLADQNCED